MTIIRTAKVKVDLTARQQTVVDHTNNLVHQRASEMCEKLLAMRAETCVTRQGEVLNPDRFIKQQQQWLFQWNLSTPGHLKTIYDAIVATPKPRGYMSPLFDSSSNTGKTSRINKKTGERNPIEPGKALCRQLLDAQILPFRFRTAPLPGCYDYAAWDMAVSHVRSWDAVNKTTQANYAKMKQEVLDMQPEPPLVKMYTQWKRDTKCIVNEKLLDKVEQFGFDVYYRADEMELAKSLNNDLAVWLNLFKWDEASQKLASLRDCSYFTFPDPTTSIRAISYGVNYTHFTVSLSENNRIVCNTKLIDPSSNRVIPFTLECRPTRYFRDLAITPTTNEAFQFHYTRGNNSDLPEDVAAVLKEVNLQKHQARRRKDRRESGYCYWLHLPLSVEMDVEKKAVEAEDFQFVPPHKDAELSAGIRTLSVDIGITRLLAMTVYESAHKSPKKIAEFFDGQQKNRGYATNITKLLADIEAIGVLIKFLKVLMANDLSNQHPRAVASFEKNLAHFELNLTIGMEELRTFIKVNLKKINKRYRQLKNYEVHKHRQTGLCSEMFTWIKLVKRWISIRKRWTYFGLPPLKNFEQRPGFESTGRYFANLKKDFLKKVGQRIVYHARKHNASMVIMEDLEHFRMSVRRDRDKNELLSLWSPLAIRSWCEHFAQQYGLRVLLIDPRHTSQIDAQTGEFGYRGEFDRSILHVIRDGKIAKVDADLNAADMLQRRFYNRYRDLNYLLARPVSNAAQTGVPEGTYLTEEKKKEKGESRLCSQLRHLYNSPRIFILPDGTVRTTPAKLLKVKLGKLAKPFYRHEDLWLDRDSHKLEVEKIKHLAFPKPKE